MKAKYAAPFRFFLVLVCAFPLEIVLFHLLAFGCSAFETFYDQKRPLSEHSVWYFGPKYEEDKKLRIIAHKAIRDKHIFMEFYVLIVATCHIVESLVLKRVLSRLVL